jgi:hypothetical protein
MGSYYQPVSYLRGGKRKTRKIKGGFLPSIMGNVVGAGRFMLPLALHQGYRLLNKTKKRKPKTKKMRKNNK